MSTQLSGQKISYNSTFTNQLFDCLYSKSANDAIEINLGKCMINKYFPPFCIQDWKGVEVSSPSIDRKQLLVFLDILDKSCLQEIDYINTIHKKHPNLKITYLFVNTKEEIILKYNIKKFSNTNIVFESKSHPIPRSQFGLPLTILIDCNGNIDNYMLFGAYISNFRKDFESKL